VAKAKTKAQAIGKAKGKASGKGKKHSLEEAAALVDVCKVDTNVGLHARGRHLEHPGGGVEPLCQAGDPIDGLQAAADYNKP